MGEEWTVIRVDINSHLGQYLRSKYNTGMVPAFTAINKNGEVIWKGNGTPPKIDTLINAVGNSDTSATKTSNSKSSKSP